MRELFKRKSSNNSENTEQSDITQIFDRPFYDEFWGNYRNYLIQNNSSINPCDNLYDLTGNDKYTYSGYKYGWFDEWSLWIIGWTDVAQDRICTKLRLKSDEKYGIIFDKLKNDRDSIHNNFGGELEWDDPPKYSVGVYKNNVKLGDRSTHEELYYWLRENMEKLEKVFLWQFASYFLDS